MQTLKSQISWCRRIQYLLGMALVVLGVIFYFAGYRPRTEKTRQVVAKIAQAKQELQDGQDKARVIPDVAKKLTELNARLKDFKTLPRNRDIGQFMREITEVSHQADLRKLEVTFSGAINRSQQYTEMPLSLHFEGDFVSVFNFLRQAEDLPRLTRVSSLSIRGTDVKDGKAGLVQVEMSMSLYFSEG
jgi:Tfp pilus assembly protein PilO